ncbi:MAG TPA: hypothetical protein VHM69_10975, partial [Rubrobacter sp.]|nr:hypothetical protein [Rubrobacter sp.]
AGPLGGVDGLVGGNGFSPSSLVLLPAFVGWPFLPVFYSDRSYNFRTFYHPYLNVFMRALNRDGVDGLLRRSIQVDSSSDYFASSYSPTELVGRSYPRDDVDFSEGGAYAQYNWELFFHAPFMVADRLSKNQRFEEAQRWFHYVFDPTDTSALPTPQRFWRTRPFYETTDEEYQKENIPNLLRLLATHGNPQVREDLEPEERARLEEIEAKVNRWRKNPFNPHLIARMRTTAYQKTVVMKYIDNLIAWGDQLFRQDTMESINEATQLYVLAAELLGRRPEEIPPRAVAEVHTYDTLEPRLDEFSNALVRIEEFVPLSNVPAPATTSEQSSLTLPTMLYFCVPKNDKLLGYWDTVADRLFKIRHCMNIEGVVRKLDLFGQPIDPALLVRAAASGVDIGSALSDVNAALPHYRFNVMAQKANELCSELKGLGSALLSALEKRDAEALALLRSSQEIKVLDAARQVKERQIDEANEALEGLKRSREVVEIRRNYYDTREFMSLWESTQIGLMAASLVLRGTEIGALILSGGLHLIPNAKIGAPTSLGVTYGGDNVANSAKSFGASLGEVAALTDQSASMAATMGNHQRRMDDWKHQGQLAAKELEQIDKQIVAAEIRKAIAEQELKNHDLQVENAEEVDAFMRDKYTNRELYNWMVGQISSVYFQSYQLAYDVAKRAERAYRHELGLQDSSFVKFGYWDNLRKGLLAGERLHHDVKRMEVAYLEQNAREYEITKHVSLARLDPMALARFKETGECFVNVPEAAFDLDYAGHYMRRIKSVGVSIPCVTGPYTGVNCTLTLLKSSVRHSTALTGGNNNGRYAREEVEDSRFTDSVGAIQSIVTSSGQNDAGMFEPNLRDERYLPFEGAGAISEWRLELPKEFRQFDYDTISDVVLHLRYTAREGGDRLKQQAISELEAAINEAALSEGKRGLANLFSAKHEFSSEWHRFLGATGKQELKLSLTQDRYPYVFSGRTITVDRVDLLVRLSEGFDVADVGTDIKFRLKISDEPDSEPVKYKLPAEPNLGEALHILAEEEEDIGGSPGEWTLTVGDPDSNPPQPRLNPDAVEDIGVVVHYTVA